LAQGPTSVVATFEKFVVGTGAAALVEPRGVAVDGKGVLYVADSATRHIQRFASDGKSLGAVDLPIDAPGQPWDIASAPDGTVVACEPETGTLWRITRDGKTDRIGSGTFAKPRGIGTDAAGNVYVAETAGNKVTKVSPTGQVLQSFEAKVKNVPPLLDQPTDVAVDAQGNLYVVEPDHGRLERLSPSGASLGVWEIPKGNTSVAPHLAALPRGNVAVTLPDDHKVVVVDNAGQIVGQIGTPGVGDGQVTTPFGVATDPSGSFVYVSDFELKRIAVFKLSR
ncbi:MAG TPA: NHL repeat-containing protein, partial [Chloroflexota bacterium]|nr:NHL repeat-containing protein [Chloroflexota bacterium]